MPRPKISKDELEKYLIKGYKKFLKSDGEKFTFKYVKDAMRKDGIIEEDDEEFSFTEKEKETLKKLKSANKEFFEELAEKQREKEKEKEREASPVKKPKPSKKRESPKRESPEKKKPSKKRESPKRESLKRESPKKKPGKNLTLKCSNMTKDEILQYIDSRGWPKPSKPMLKSELCDYANNLERKEKRGEKRESPEPKPQKLQKPKPSSPKPEKEKPKPSSPKPDKKPVKDLKRPNKECTNMTIPELNQYIKDRKIKPPSSKESKPKSNLCSYIHSNDKEEEREEREANEKEEEDADTEADKEEDDKESEGDESELKREIEKVNGMTVAKMKEYIKNNKLPATKLTKKDDIKAHIISNLKLRLKSSDGKEESDAEQEEIPKPFKKPSKPRVCDEFESDVGESSECKPDLKPKPSKKRDVKCGNSDFNENSKDEDYHCPDDMVCDVDSSLCKDSSSLDKQGMVDLDFGNGRKLRIFGSQDNIRKLNDNINRIKNPRKSPVREPSPPRIEDEEETESEGEQEQEDSQATQPFSPIITSPIKPKKFCGVDDNGNVIHCDDDETCDLEEGGKGFCRDSSYENKYEEEYSYNNKKYGGSKDSISIIRNKLSPPLAPSKPPKKRIGGLSQKREDLELVKQAQKNLDSMLGIEEKEVEREQSPSPRPKPKPSSPKPQVQPQSRLSPSPRPRPESPPLEPVILSQSQPSQSSQPSQLLSLQPSQFPVDEDKLDKIRRRLTDVNISNKIIRLEQAKNSAMNIINACAGLSV